MEPSSRHFMPASYTPPRGRRGRQLRTGAAAIALLTMVFVGQALGGTATSTPSANRGADPSGSSTQAFPDWVTLRLASASVHAQDDDDDDDDESPVVTTPGSGGGGGGDTVSGSPNFTG